MSFDTAAGAVVALSATLPATVDASGYGALTYTSAVEITQIGEFGRMYALVTHQPLASRGVKKAKGSFNDGQFSPTMAFDKTDAGQLILEAAELLDTAIAIKITLDGGEIFYMQGLVMGLSRSIGESDSIVIMTPTIEVVSDSIIEA
tara:strand:+ start:9260 stop:9700 length:441 start_codon:yes stop_codon:yes gene_type:complete